MDLDRSKLVNSKEKSSLNIGNFLRKPNSSKRRHLNRILLTLLTCLAWTLQVTQSKPLIKVISETGSVQPFQEQAGDSDQQQNEDWLLATVAATAASNQSSAGAEGDNSAEVWFRFGAIKENLPLFALLSVINLCVVLGNILVIISILLTAKLQSVTNTFIVSLASADLMLGLFVLPYSLIYEVVDVWIFGEFWCHGWLVTDVWICTASILNLCAISVDRYVAVTRPVKYRYIMTRRKAKSIVAGVWIVSFLICSPPLLQHWRPQAAPALVRRERQLLDTLSRKQTTGGPELSPTHRLIAQPHSLQMQNFTHETIVSAANNSLTSPTARTSRNVTQLADELQPSANGGFQRLCRNGYDCNLNTTSSRKRNKRAEKNDNATDGRKQIQRPKPLGAITVIDKKLSASGRHSVVSGIEGPKEYISIVVAEVVPSGCACPVACAGAFLNIERPPIEMDGSRSSSGSGSSRWFIVLNCSVAATAVPAARKPPKAVLPQTDPLPLLMTAHQQLQPIKAGPASFGRWFASLPKKSSTSRGSGRGNFSKLVNGDGAARFRESSLLLLLLLQQQPSVESKGEEEAAMQRAINQSDSASSSATQARQRLEAIELLTCCYRHSQGNTKAQEEDDDVGFRQAVPGRKRPISSKRRFVRTAFTSSPERADFIEPTAIHRPQAHSIRLVAQKQFASLRQVGAASNQFIVVSCDRPIRGWLHLRLDPDNSANRSETPLSVAVADGFSAARTRVSFNELVVVDSHLVTSSPRSKEVAASASAPAPNQDQDLKSQVPACECLRQQSIAKPRSENNDTGNNNSNVASATETNTNQVEFLGKGARDDHNADNNQQQSSTVPQSHISRKRPDTGDRALKLVADPSGDNNRDQVLLLAADAVVEIRPRPVGIETTTTTSDLLIAQKVHCFCSSFCGLLEGLQKLGRLQNYTESQRFFAAKFRRRRDVTDKDIDNRRLYRRADRLFEPMKRGAQRKANEPSKGDNGHLNLVKLNGAKTMASVGSLRQNHRLLALMPEPTRPTGPLAAKDKSRKRLGRQTVDGGKVKSSKQQLSGLSAQESTDMKSAGSKVAPVEESFSFNSAQRRKSGCDLFDDRSYVIYSSFGSFYIPMLVMLFFYSRIYLVASRAHKARQRGYMTTKWPVSGSTRSGKRLGDCESGSAGGCGQADSLSASGSGKGGFSNERVTLRIHRREKSAQPPPLPSPAVATGPAAGAAVPQAKVPPAIVTPERTGETTTSAVESEANEDQSPVLQEVVKSPLPCASGRSVASDGRVVALDASAVEADVTSLGSVVITQTVEQQESQDGFERAGGCCSPNDFELSQGPKRQPEGGNPLSDEVEVASQLADPRQAENDDEQEEKLDGLTLSKRISQESCHNPQQQQQLNHRRHRDHSGSHHHHRHHHHHNRHHQHQHHDHHHHHRHHHRRHKHRHHGRQHHSACTCTCKELHHNQRHQHQRHHHSHRHQSHRHEARCQGAELRIATEPSRGDARRNSVKSVQITVSQYDECKPEMDLPGIYQETHEPPTIQFSADESHATMSAHELLLSRRVDRSHSCVPTPSIVVNWNQETNLTSSEVTNASTLLQSPTGSICGNGSQHIQRPSTSPNHLTGSQGSGLSLIANLPSAANQVRKQSIMLLNTLTTRSTQTLRRLSMVATHPMDSLLKRSKSRESSDYDDDDSSTNVDGTQTGGEDESTPNKGRTSEGDPLDKKRRQRRRRRRKKKRMRKRVSVSQHQGSKKTLDDYLMAVAGIDSSTDADDHHSSDQEEFEEDDDDDDNDEELDEEDAQVDLGKPVKHLLYNQQILVPGIRLSSENIDGVDAATTIQADKSPEDEVAKSEAHIDDAAEDDARPPSALHRQGGYYERATSRSILPAENANNSSVVSAFKRSINGMQRQTNLEESKPAQVIVSAGFDQKNKPQGVYHHHLMSKSRAPRRRAKRTSRWHAKRLHAETKAAKTVAIIVGGFIFCWLPFFTAYLSRAIICETTDCIPQSLFSLFVWLGYLNSAINPVIYGLFSADFRHAFKNILCRCRFRNTDDTVVVSVLVDSIIKSIL